MTSPYGALVPGVTPAMFGTAEEAAAFGGDLEFRYGRLDAGAADLHSIGVGARLGNLGIVGAWQVCNGCGQRSLAGVEYDIVLSRARRSETLRSFSFVSGVRPGLGLGVVSGEGEAVLAVATTLDVPLSMAIPVGARLWLVPHLEPGIGNGFTLDGGRRESGVHASIAGGVSVMEFRPGVGLNVGYRRIIHRGSPGTWGIGLTLRRDTPESAVHRWHDAVTPRRTST